MKGRRKVDLILLVWMVVSLAAGAYGAEKRRSIVGTEILNFTLPSTEDRVINYAEEYYGKSNLIITFFPAAYTPI